MQFASSLGSYAHLNTAAVTINAKNPRNAILKPQQAISISAEKEKREREERNGNGEHLY